MFCRIFIYLLGLYLVHAEEQILPLNNKNAPCKHCTQKGNNETSSVVSGAFLVLEKLNTVVNQPDRIVPPFKDVPEPPKLGVEDSAANDTESRSLNLTIGEIPHVVPEPKYIPEVRVYDSLIEDLVFPPDTGSENSSEVEEEEYDDLVLTRLQLGGKMDIVSKKTEDGLEFKGIDSFDLCCTNLDTVPKTSGPKSSRLRGKKHTGDESQECNCGENGPVSYNHTVYELLKLDLVPRVDKKDSSSGSSQEGSSDMNITTSEHTVRRLASCGESADCDLCSSEGKCFYHRNTVGTLATPPESEGEQAADAKITTSPSTSTTTTTVATSSSTTTSTTTASLHISEDDRSSFVSDEVSNEERRNEGLDAAKSAKDERQDIDVRTLARNLNNLVDLVKEGKEEQIKTQKELRKERELLAKIVLDLRDTKNVTQLYMQLTKVEMEISLLKQALEQLKRDEEKAKSTNNMLTRYENRINSELELAKLKYRESKDPQRFERAVNKLEKRKSVTQGIQIDVNKRLAALKESIAEMEKKILDLVAQKTRLEKLMQSVNSGERISFDEVDDSQ
ncbi:hypothetical protein HWI79_1946 [Cryptosporidium felis]|nr:hypothetical protein HWI79_1946 [Cryptosporidium felis]